MADLTRHLLNAVKHYYSNICIMLFNDVQGIAGRAPLARNDKCFYQVYKIGIMQ
jgi:hypothetical protein